MTSISLLRVRFVAVALLVGLLNIPGPVRSQPGPGVEALPDDDIVLDLFHGATSSEVVLRWTGGLPAFTVYRATAPAAVVSPPNNIGGTSSAAWIDVPPPGVILYYQVRGTGCASNAGCPTGHCADSYCCDTACDALCQACNLSGAEGTCIPIAAGENPGDECGPGAACDGTGACLLLDGVDCSDDRACLSAACGTFTIDADSDGYGAAGGPAVQVCGHVPPPGYSDIPTDCNDAKASIHPGAVEEVGDQVDQDCDGRELCYVDADDDGFHATGTVLSLDADCADLGEANAAEPGGDCNDANSSIHPGAIEVVGDDLDENCDGRETCFVDGDGDGFRTALTVQSGDNDCADPGEARASQPGGDCNDANSSIHPGAIEVVGDDLDENCDGRELCFADGDGDGFHTASTVVSTDPDCGDPGEARASQPGGDCCDISAQVFPGQTAYSPTSSPCGGFDYNCDGSSTLQFPTLASGSVACHGSPPLCIADPGLGWVASVPACGVSGTFHDCNMASCSTISVTRIQSCR